MTILAIETSCDETGVAIVQGTMQLCNVVHEAVASQIDVHAITGGVVPEVAAREHREVLLPMIQDAMKKTDTIDAIAVTYGPGLMPALIVGVQVARTLAYSLDKPLIPVNHLAGHIYSGLYRQEKNNYMLQEDSLPALALLVSGGHTMLVKISTHGQYEVLGNTKDDAVGEVFDKVARMLDLPYPGGPEVSRLAEQGDPKAFDFPRPMTTSGDLDFSYSGLKTSVLYALRDNPDANRADICASFQQAVVDSVMYKVDKALQQDEYKTAILAGGVAANRQLRQAFLDIANKHNVIANIAPQVLCGDNATMIGLAGMIDYHNNKAVSWKEVDAVARPTL